MAEQRATSLANYVLILHLNILCLLQGKITIEIACGCNEHDTTELTGEAVPIIYI